MVPLANYFPEILNWSSHMLSGMCEHALGSILLSIKYVVNFNSANVVGKLYI